MDHLSMSAEVGAYLQPSSALEVALRSPQVYTPFYSYTFRIALPLHVNGRFHPCDFNTSRKS
ncbi:hypothetical protein BDN71DRAFT_1445584 [Pleurotus eryngii]|uniref:Uncharacterized protein n=1 Tax=Pleurotus eryngii TaxID=5323 RepID=A0A9P6A324_PLEER|nr:hypothetical protein BDN71DRAFT_1445584 [Pleurotus eryngii]